ncbi:Carboxypeptidase-related protein [Indibacter alkaliphilus LW1]|uniref:Carboxypeptidase-related protein n=1 Tax=Indibacter alkaliphilus (strain CCUG 57479 / KCTC 22604 / LW1) TaxID=1189612 RepID=S2D9V9_INDAL|nr:septum formation initiator [Indibacter alkaliphilus]EOZ96022.1 Carboxypeptidase-related protein [Indibacter alkaliphilus LW1]
MKKALILIYFICAFGSAQESDPKLPEPKLFESQHEGTFHGVKVRYKTIAGETYLKNDQGEPVASIWSTAYVKQGSDSKRPVIFIFNGGPGSASIWLHMGVFGPRIVQVESDASEDDGAAPYKVIHNDLALLDMADLVFVDPVGTGYSKVIGQGKVEDFWGLNEDAASIAGFIRVWITRNKRWQSPKYIAGESFGTTRAAAVTAALEKGGQSMALNGLILISQALDYQGSTSTHDNIASYFTYFPTMAATAWYHKKAGKGQDLEDFVAESRDFAYKEYLPALYKGSQLSTSEKDKIADRIAYFLGLEKDYILLSDNRILTSRFKKELLRQEGKTIGTLDSRYLGEEGDATADRPTLGDPSGYGTDAAYTAALQEYFANTLNIEMEDRPYLTSNSKIYGKWNWRPVPQGVGWEPSYVNVARSLGESMRRNKDLKVMVANGYYDMITPFLDAEYTFARHDIPQERVEMFYYEGGHMMYNHRPDFEKLVQDIRKFLK